MSSESLFVPSRNCWRTSRADRVTFLIDAEAYFGAVRRAIREARRAIYICGWDIDSRLRLLRGGPGDGFPEELGEFIRETVARRRGLRASVLIWDFAMIYALDREWLPLFIPQWHRHRRVAFRMDSHHPIGGSHHEKYVVVDDRIAFAGGMDLTRERWDTPEHLPEDPRRIRPGGDPYGPFHDVQMMVEGEAARSLGDLFRERWRRATGKRLEPPVRLEGDLPGARRGPDLENVDVAIARTRAPYDGQGEIREVERLYLDMIEAAERWIYLENQFFTCNAVGEALERRLREPGGPEVIVVLRLKTEGWLDESVMDVLRGRLLKRLRDADAEGRLRVYYPDREGLDDEYINVHAKVAVVDDRIARVGSANLNNRSMGLDSECDLAVDARGRPEAVEAVARFRNTLLAEHLGRRAEEVARALQERGTLIAAIESLRGGERTLAPLEGLVSDAMDRRVPEAAIVDPERPVDPHLLVEQFVTQEHRGPVRRRGLRFLAFLALLLLAAAAWRFTPLGEGAGPEEIAAWLDRARGAAIAPPLVLLAYLLGALVVFPVTLLVVATAVVFGPWEGFLYALAGALASGSLTYVLGSRLGRDTIRRMAGSRVNRLSRMIGRRGIVAMMLLRIFPVAPFTVVNVVCGASHMRFRDYMIGTLLGMGPGILVLSLFAGRVADVIRNPDPVEVLALVAVGLLLGAIVLVVARWLGKREPPAGR